MKVTIVFGGKSQEIEVDPGTTVRGLVKLQSRNLDLPDKMVISYNGIAVSTDEKDDALVLAEDDTIECRSAEAVYGVGSVDISDMVGRKVGEIVRTYGAALNIPEDENLMISVFGKNKDMGYRVEPGDQIEFVKKNGRKLRP